MEAKPMQDGENNSIWVAVGTIASMHGGAVLKTFGDLVGREDRGEEEWRTDMIKDQSDLRAWNQRQQTAIEKLEREVGEEKEARHKIKNDLNAAEMLLQEAKMELKAMAEKNVALEAENKTLLRELSQHRDKAT